MYVHTYTSYTSYVAMSYLGKRKHVVLSLDEKIAILDKLRTEQTRSSIAKEYNVGCATVTSPKNNEKKLRSFVSTMDGMEASKKGSKVMCLAHDDQLDKVIYMYLWFTQRRSQNMPISGPMLCEKAAQLHKTLHEGEGLPPFLANRGWLWHLYIPILTLKVFHKYLS